MLFSAHLGTTHTVQLGTPYTLSFTTPYAAFIPRKGTRRGLDSRGKVHSFIQLLAYWK